MYKRLLLLSLGWKTHDPYERGVQVALHAYHRALLGSVLLVFTISYAIGFLVTGSKTIAIFFFVLPLFAHMKYLLELLKNLFAYSILLYLMFLAFLIISHGAVITALLLSLGALIVSLTLITLSLGNTHEQSIFSKQPHLFTESQCLTKDMQNISREKNIPPIAVYIRKDQSWNAQAHRYGPSRFISINEVLHIFLSEYELRGALAHELGHFVIPLGEEAYDYSHLHVLGIGNKLTLYFEDKAWMMYEKQYIPLDMFKQDGENRWKYAQFRWLLKIAYACSMVSIFPSSRKRELVADACSALILRDAMPLLGALSNSLNGKKIMRISSTHPSNKERIANLRGIEESA